MIESPVYGLMAEFENPEDLISATRQAHQQGYRKMEAYSPFPVEELNEITGFKTILPYLVFIGGIVGIIAGFGLQYYVSVIEYPLIIGGRPFNSLPAFIVVIFELTILVSALVAVFGMLALNGLPMPYHPVFNVPRFARASRDRFFLCIETQDPKFDLEKTKQFLENQKPEEVFEVEN